MRPQQTVRTVAKQRGRRAVVSAAAVVALLLGTVGTAVATAAPDDGDTDTNADNDTGPAADAVYQPCYPNFGLGKVAEIVVEVDGSVPTPPLTFPDDVDVVTTFHPDGPDAAPVTCIPQPVTDDLWANHSLWGFLGIDPPVGNYVFLPVGDQNDPCTESQTMRLVGQPAGYTVEVSQAIVPPTPDTSCGDAATDAVNAAAEAIMSPDEFMAFTDWFNNDVICDNTTPDPDLLDAAAVMVGALNAQFHTLYLTASEGDLPCDKVGEAYVYFAYQTTYDLEVGRQAVFELTTPPTPTTTTTPAPTPAPAAVVAAPAFTG